jgi:regulation of enolase protein 1 (concanavalin A-like superfamily)
MTRIKFLASAAGVLAAAILIAAMGAARHSVQAEEPEAKSPAERPDKAKGPNAESGFSFQAFEGFHGKLLLNWQPVRSDPTHVSLTKHPGALTITTQRGTIHGDANAHGEPFAKNIFVIANPLGKDADFVMTTCVSNFTPTQAYQQAALICYDDDDNYLKWSYEFNSRTGIDQYFVLVREIAQKPEHFAAEGVAGLKHVWLRLTKRGKSYEYATSADGKAYVMRGEQEWGDGAPKMLGILAKNGGPEGVPEIDAQFDFFELRSPAPPRAGEEKK